LGKQDNSLSYSDLFEASKLFESDFYAFDDAWLDARRGVDWDRLHELPTEDVTNDVIGFLNKWKCRLPYSSSLADAIKKAHEDSIIYIKALQDETIEDWNPNTTKNVGGEILTNQELLLNIYSRFAGIGEHFSHVAASKVLHFLLPELVVMWDNTIALNYGTIMTNRIYVSRFIPQMKRLANQAIYTYQAEKGCSREEAVSALKGFRPPKTIAKLLDEYNYMKYTRGIEIGEDKGQLDQGLSAGSRLRVRAIEGRDGRVISRAPDGRVILFDNTDPISARIKSGDILDVRAIKAAKTYLICRVVEPPETRESERESTPTLTDLFARFREMRDFKAGEGIIEASVDSWMAARKKAKELFKEIFHPENLGEMSADDFASFLYFRNNRAWTQLYRQGLQITKDIEGLRKVISHLQDESIDVATRIGDVMRGGRLHLRGFGKNLATGVLHVCDRNDQYGVWNNRTEDALKILGRSPPMSKDHGSSYSRINKELTKLKRELGTDLVMIDGFMWYVSKFHSKD